LPEKPREPSLGQMSEDW